MRMMYAPLFWSEHSSSRKLFGIAERLVQPPTEALYLWGKVWKGG